jgi:ATP-dependent exoDNAse (exonuclease V) beta subunit
MKKPSVTQLLDLLAKPALIGWANKQGLAGIDIEISRKKTLEAGTSIHSQIENYCKGEGDFINDIDRTRFCYFKRDKKLLCVEKEIETEWFIGRYDVKFEHNGKHVIVDYKSGFKGKV